VQRISRTVQNGVAAARLGVGHSLLEAPIANCDGVGVAQIAEAVAVAIRLRRICDGRTVIARIGLAVAVGVGIAVIRHAVGVAVPGRPTREFARVMRAVAVAVDHFAIIGHAIPVAVGRQEIRPGQRHPKVIAGVDGREAIARWPTVQRAIRMQSDVEVVGSCDRDVVVARRGRAFA